MNPRGSWDPHFEPLLRSFPLESFERADQTVFGMWPDCRLAYHNPAWTRFSRENGASPDFAERWSLGCQVLDAVPDVLRTFYSNLFKSVLVGIGDSGRPLQHEYECSTPDRYRRFAVTLYPAPEAAGIVAVNSLFVARAHDPVDRPAMPARSDVYTGADGLVHQCVHCRRVKHATSSGRWDWVAEWVKSPPPSICHTLCDPCSAVYFRS